MKVGIDYIGVTVCFHCHDGRGNWLYHKRSKNCRDEQGNWDVGGGQLEFGEAPDEGVLREVREEYGCDAIIQSKLPAISYIRENAGRKTHWICFPYILQVDPAEVRNNEPNAIDEIGWFRLDVLPTPLHSTIRARIEMYRDYFAQYI